MKEKKYKRIDLFDLITDFVIYTVANYYIGEYTTYVEVIIITWLFFRFLYLRRYELFINNESINFYNLDKKVLWNDVTKITFSDGTFWSAIFIDLNFYDINPIVQINIEYERDGVKDSIKFLLTRYFLWKEIIDKIKHIINTREIIYKKSFKYDVSDKLIFGTKEEQKPLNKTKIIFAIFFLLLLINKVRKFFY